MSALYSLSSFVCFLVCHVAGYRKSVVIQNITRSFPDKNYEEVRSIMKKFYNCFSNYFAEIIKGISVPIEKLKTKVSFENMEIIDTLINGGRNVIACLGHCGNWEMLNMLPCKLSHDVYAIYKPLKVKTINELMIKIRSRFGIKLIPDHSVVRHILSGKIRSSVYLFLSDQCPQIKDDKYRFVFLNQETYLFSGMEKLARKTDSAVVYLHLTQISKGNYKVKCLPVCSAAGVTDEGQITKKYVELLTENIKEQPYSWLWTHKRWKK
jgi:KDO2-lipid IV(A) lauroyltransferase